MAQTEITPARSMASAGRKRVRIDWKRGASLMIDGETPTAICAALGIDEDRLWRHLRSSLRFQYLLRQARERRRLLGQLKLETVSREAAVRLARSADKPDAMLIAQLASTAQGEGDGTAETGDVVARLAESGRRPPNQAFRKRLAVERRQMDAEFEAYRRADAARKAVPQAADKPAQTGNKTQISENKPGVSAEKPVRGEGQPHPAQGASISPGASVSGRARGATDALPFGMLPGLQSGGIVDLTDRHGNPLLGVQNKWDPGSSPG